LFTHTCLCHQAV